MSARYETPRAPIVVSAHLASERTCWAEDTGLSPDEVDALTLIAEEAYHRGLAVDLSPRDVWREWPTELRSVGADDLADRVEEIEQARDDGAVQS